MSAADDYQSLALWAITEMSAYKSRHPRSAPQALAALDEIDRLRAIETALRGLVTVDEAINWDDQPPDQWCDAIDAARLALGMPVSA